MKRSGNSERGIALIMSLGVLAILLILATTFAFRMRVEQQAARNYLYYVSAEYFAKAGLERAVAELRAGEDDGYFTGIGESSSDFVSEGILLGRFTVDIEDESGKLNINHAGNLSALGGGHGQNEGWTTYEISIADVFASADDENEELDRIRDNAELLAERIILYRYDGDDAGESEINEHVESDGIDNDGSGEIDQSGERDPLWFSPWGGWARDADWQPFLAASHLYTADEAFSNFWAAEWGPFWRDSITARSSAPERKRLNINAGDEVWAYMGGLGYASSPTRARRAVNIMDYRDANHALSSFTLANQLYYGTESILINEVLANSYDVRDSDADGEPFVNTLTGPAADAIKTFTVAGLAPNTAYRLRLWSKEDDFWVRVGDGEERGPADWEEDPANSGNFRIDYPLDENCRSDEDGQLLIETRPHDDQDSVDKPPEPMTDETLTVTIGEDEITYEATASGEYVVYENGNIVEERRAWHAFDENPATYWRRQGNLEEIILPPGNMTGFETSIEGVAYRAWASAYEEGAEPWRAFGAGYWGGEHSTTVTRMPTVAMSSNTHGGYTADASENHLHAYRAFDKNENSYWGWGFSAPGTAIRTEADLNDVRDNLGGTYYLANNLELTAENWEPIEGFWGLFDGRDFSISGLRIDRPEEDGVGLFGHVLAAGRIINLNIREADVAGRHFVGAASGLNEGRLLQVFSSGLVRGAENAGGLAGLNAGEISASHSSASVSGPYAAGGLAGLNSGEIRFSYSTGSASGLEEEESYFAGGLAGYNEGGIEASWSSAAAAAGYYAGGLAGGNAGSIENSYASGSVYAEIHTAGGLAGLNEDGAEIIRSYSKGPVGGINAGGLVGWNDGDVTASFWDVDASGVGESGDDNFGATGRTTVEMLTRSTYTDAGWNFPVWRMESADHIVLDPDEREALAGMNPGDTCYEVETGDTYFWSGERWEFFFYDWRNGGYPFLPSPRASYEIEDDLWISIDLGEPEFANELRISAFPRYGPRDFMLQAWDGSGWQTVYIGTAADRSGWQDFEFEGGEYRQWRLRIDTAYNPGEIRIRRLDLGNRRFEGWVALDMGERRTVHEVRITNRPSYGVNNFALQGSNDGSNWADIYEDTADDTGVEQEFEIPSPASYRYWRLFARTGHNPRGVLRIDRIRYISKELDPGEWIALDMGRSETVHSVRITNVLHHGISDFRVRGSHSEPPEGAPLPSGWGEAVYSGTAANNESVQEFSFGEEDFQYWAVEILSVYDEGGEIRVDEIKFVGGDACKIEQVEFTCAEFIGFVNIGGADVDIGGWSIEVEVEGEDPEDDAFETLIIPPVIPPVSVVPPGGYFAVTNDGALFDLSYPGAVYDEIKDGWDSGWGEDGKGIFPQHGGRDILLRDAGGRLADLAVHRSGTENILGTDIANVSRIGNSGMIGRSIEKNDPSIRYDWYVNDAGDSGASPGGHNSRLSEEGKDILDALFDETHPDYPYPPLVKNSLFATIAELAETYDWKVPSSVKYAGVRTGAGEHWEPMPVDVFEHYVGIMTAGHVRRLDADFQDTSHTWEDARFDYNYGRHNYLFYLYDEDDEYVGRADDDPEAVREDGSVRINHPEAFKYAFAVPAYGGSIRGRININTASKEVLMGLPGIDETLADDIIVEARARGYSNTAQLLSRGVLSRGQFAPVANLVCVDSSVFRVVSTGEAFGPGGEAAVAAAVYEIEALVDRSGGRVRVLSWKVAE